VIIPAPTPTTPMTWLITGTSSGFGRYLTEQLLDRGDTGRRHPASPRAPGRARPPPRSAAVDALAGRHQHRAGATHHRRGLLRPRAHRRGRLQRRLRPLRCRRGAERRTDRAPPGNQRHGRHRPGARRAAGGIREQQAGKIIETQKPRSRRTRFNRHRLAANHPFCARARLWTVPLWTNDPQPWRAQRISSAARRPAMGSCGSEATRSSIGEASRTASWMATTRLTGLLFSPRYSSWPGSGSKTHQSSRTASAARLASPGCMSMTSSIATVAATPAG
jgi:hypothetical protein